MFKRDFKYYKRKCPMPDFSALVDFRKCSPGTSGNILEAPLLNDDIDFRALGLNPCSEWKLHSIPERKGLMFVQNPFTSSGQRYWVRRCLEDFTQKPQKLNLDAHGDLSEGEDWWNTCLETKGTQRSQMLLQKLRWATLGYHHNWDTKIYSEDVHTPFPEDLATLCCFVARVLGFGDFSAEAAIVNFYHMDSTLSGHTDHSEVNKEAPLFSFSFGQSAIFLLGGRSLEEKPTAMLIRSGDIVVMSGESRLCYHGVPRIIEADEFPWSECKDKTWEPFQSYLSSSRININVRQVLHPGSKSL